MHVIIDKTKDKIYMAGNLKAVSEFTKVDYDILRYRIGRKKIAFTSPKWRIEKLKHINEL